MGQPGQQAWAQQQSKFPGGGGGGGPPQGINPTMNARNQQNPQNFQSDHFLGDGRSASTVAPQAAATSSSDVDRDLAHKGGNKGSNASTTSLTTTTSSSTISTSLPSAAASSSSSA